MNCIETEQLSFQYSKNEMIINNIDLKVPQSSIYGFLGPNGAGKTTTLKLLLGLLKQNTGSIKIFEQPFENNRIEILKKIGSLIEAPSFYSHLTAIENLRILQRVFQCSKSRIYEVLDIVGLSSVSKKKTINFSFGMKQRLGIAIALLHSPELLILDEPTNGLDPNGIIEIRELLIKLQKENNITILVSSHLLSEVEKIVSHVGIINNGDILFQGTLGELQLKQSESSFVNFETSNIEKTIEIFSQYNLKFIARNGIIETQNIDKELISKLNQQLVSQKIDVYQISLIKNDLESIFIDLTKSMK